MSGLALATRITIILASLLLGLGLVGPCMVVTPGFGEYTRWVKVFKPGLVEPKTYSIISGAMHYITDDSLAIGILLMAFSVVFPAVKLATLWWGATMLQAGRPGGTALWLTHHAGKFSMLDVMVVAVLVLAVKGLPGSTTVEPGWGLFVFSAAVLLSIAASVMVSQMEKRLDADNAKGPPSHTSTPPGA